MASSALTIALGCLVVFFSSKWLAYRKAVARIGNQPGPRLLFNPLTTIGNILPPIPFISPGPGFVWRSKRAVFDKVGTDIYGYVGLAPTVSGYFVSDIEAIKEIIAPRSAFKKNSSNYRVLATFGSNLLTTEGSEWKRQRRICAPAFSDRNNKLVWSTAAGFVDDIISTWAIGEPVHVHDICEDITLPIALCVIAKAGYGQDVKWKDNDHPPPGHELTFKQALLTVSDNIFLPLMMPNWAWGLRKSWMDVKKANDELRLYLQEMVSARREIQDMATRSLAKEKHDLFNQLVHAYDESDMLSEEELIGNAFIFLVAGHETTAHTLALALTLLALYPDEQTKLVEQIERARPKDRDFTYDDMPKMQYAMAVLYETLRIYPIVSIIPKHAVSDTTITTKSRTSHATTSFDAKALTPVAIIPLGLHYNPQYWDDPTAFVPARFMDPSWNRDAFIPFSVGPRSCIGRRFAETTVVATLVAMLSKYSVSVDETMFKSIPGESIIDRRERLMNLTFRLTLVPQKVALVFTPRV